MYRFLLGTLLAASLHACQQRPGTDVEAVRRIIDKHNADLERWYAAGQVDSVAARFAEDVWVVAAEQSAVGRARLAPRLLEDRRHMGSMGVRFRRAGRCRQRVSGRGAWAPVSVLPLSGQPNP
jgi:hypothetical protein